MTMPVANEIHIGLLTAETSNKIPTLNLGKLEGDVHIATRISLSLTSVLNFIHRSYILWRKMASIAFMPKGKILRQSCFCA